MVESECGRVLKAPFLRLALHEEHALKSALAAVSTAVATGFAAH
jgi:hypothetical protein